MSEVEDLNVKDIKIPKEQSILWQKWSDVYKNIVDELKNDATSFEEGQSGEEEGEIEEELYQNNIQTILTPFGILPINDSVLASTHFKFWMGHTNFKLRKHHIMDISKINGVESLSVHSPHRFLISIGWLFSDREVMEEIRQKITDILPASKK